MHDRVKQAIDLNQLTNLLVRAIRITSTFVFAENCACFEARGVRPSLKGLHNCAWKACDAHDNSFRQRHPFACKELILRPNFQKL